MVVVVDASWVPVSGADEVVGKASVEGVVSLPPQAAATRAAASRSVMRDDTVLVLTGKSSLGLVAGRLPTADPVVLSAFVGGLPPK